MNTSYLDKDDGFRLNVNPTLLFTNMAIAITYVELLTGRNYDFFTFEDRVLLGETLMNQNRGSGE